MILNLGCGERIFEDSVNVDITAGKGVDLVMDISKLPWRWENNTIDGIHLYHIIEHFPLEKQYKIIEECHRVLKTGGFLIIAAPHTTSMRGRGMWAHYSAYNVDTFHCSLDAKTRGSSYLFAISFKTEYNYINWIVSSVFDKKCDFPQFPRWARKINCYLAPIINKLINISPRIFERVWYPLVGGASEVIWKGVKR